MNAQAPTHLAPDELAALEALLQRLRQWGSVEIVYQDGRAVVAHLKLTLKPPLPRWVKLLAAASPESLRGRPA